MPNRWWATLILLLASTAFVRADGPADNNPETVRRVPKLGIEVAPNDVAELQARLDKLAGLLKQLATLLPDPVAQARRLELIPDVEIYYKAVHDTLVYNEFHNPPEVAVAAAHLNTGIDRAEQLLAGDANWTTATGLVVRGYRSKIDGSVQPYGLVIPDSYRNIGLQKSRLDFWFHGRGEVLSEVNFIEDRRKNVGQISPPETIVVHPYGRWCNANKFAGEVDTLEVLESVRRRYRIDDDRTSVRGFSMGGAACWQFAVHYSDLWASAAPGAGFSETPDFLKVFQQETLAEPWYERKLYQWYDCTDWAVNLAQCPMVAYSGELDSQKQAADIMLAAMFRENIDLVHIIGPGTKHAYHPEAAVEVERRISSIVRRGRQRIPSTVRFATSTLKYNRMNWVTVDGLQEHWEPARVVADLTPGKNGIVARTSNITELTFSFAPGDCPFDIMYPVVIEIDRSKVSVPRPLSDRSWKVSLFRTPDGWQIGPRLVEPGLLRKRHDLQGPIDDAFMDSFIFVRPTGTALNPAVETWVQSEMKRAIEHWRRQFHGQARVKNDVEITGDDIQSANLVLWGDSSSNAVLKKISANLPIQWTADAIQVGPRTYPAAQNALIAIYPNPLNQNRYVVLNSGFTYRDYDYLNNARQTPKLPDWAVIDLSVPPNNRWPGKVADADFFGEQWELRPVRP